MLQKKNLPVAMGLFISSLLIPMLAISAPDKSFRAAEILSLPEANRKAVFKEKGADIYSSVLILAESDSTPMTLRWRAIQALPQINSKKALPSLIKISKSSIWHARNASLLALHSVKSEETKTVATKLLFDPALVVRSAAVDVLKNYVDSEVRVQLWQALNHPQNFRKGQSLWVRKQIAQALSENPKMSEQALFAGMTTDRDARVRAYGTIASKSF